MTLLLLGKPTTDLLHAKAFARQQQAKRTADVDAYLTELWSFAPKYNLDPAVLAAQSSEETAGWTSDWWTRSLNPAGLGVTGAAGAGSSFATPVEAARAHIVHLLIYARPTILHQVDYRTLRLDDRFAAPWYAGYAGKVKTVQDLAGTWATDGSYATKIERHYQELRAAISTPAPTPQPTPGGAPLPAKIVQVATGNSHVRFFGRKPIAIVYHITDDESYAGTESWFRNPASDASAHMVIDRDGVLHQFVSSTRAAWTNGDYIQNGRIVTRRDIPLLNRCVQKVQTEGGNFNDFTLNIEHVGTPSTPPNEMQYASSIAISKYWRDRWEIKPSRGTMWRHADINSVNRSYCPGPRFDLARIIKALGGDPAEMGA